MTDELPEVRRREVFAALVAKQDEGLSVPESREAVGGSFGLAARLVLAIEQEGLKSEWPPLDA